MDPPCGITHTGWLIQTQAERDAHASVSWWRFKVCLCCVRKRITLIWEQHQLLFLLAPPVELWVQRDSCVNSAEVTFLIHSFQCLKRFFYTEVFHKMLQNFPKAKNNSVKIVPWSSKWNPSWLPCKHLKGTYTADIQDRTRIWGMHYIILTRFNSKRLFFSEHWRPVCLYWLVKKKPKEG